MSITQYLSALAGCVGAADIGGGAYRIDLAGGATRAATEAEILDATKAQRIDAINAECRSRLLARYGAAEEQVSRVLGVYGAAEKAAIETGIAATIDASNTASDAVLAAATVQDVEAVSVSWPVI